MPQPKVLALILAGGSGSRMDVLTDHRAKPVLPYGGVYRLIDPPLSNLRNSGISDVNVLVQYHAQSIVEELANGRPWDLDRTIGGLRVVPPQQRDRDEDGDEIVPDGNADALLDNIDVIRAASPDVVLVLSADHVYLFDYFQAIDQHIETGASATLATTTVPVEQASDHGVCEVNRDGRVTGFAYKPDMPSTDVVLTEIFVYAPEVLIESLQRLKKETGGDLGDFGEHLLPALVEEGKVFAHPMGGYWRDLGKPDSYFASHMDLLADELELDLDKPSWPISTLQHQRLPARLREGSTVRNALVSPGCDIQGTVEHSVLAPGVTVERDAVVRNSIVLENAVIKSGAEVRNAIIDRNVEIGSGAMVGEEVDREYPGADDLVLIGQHASIHGNRKIRRGERIEGIDLLQKSLA